MYKESMRDEAIEIYPDKTASPVAISPRSRPNTLEGRAYVRYQNFMKVIKELTQNKTPQDISTHPNLRLIQPLKGGNKN